MAEAEFVAKVRTEGADEAAADLEGVAEAGEQVDLLDPALTVTADDNASPVIGEVIEDVQAVDEMEATAKLTASADSSPVSDFQDVVGGVNTTTATAHLEAEADDAPVADFIETIAGVPAQASTKVEAETAEAQTNVLDLSATLSTTAGVFTELGVTGSKQMGLLAKVTSKGALASAAALTAVGAAAKNAVDDYVKLATGAANSAKAVGMGTEEYSRWVAAVDNVGVSQAQLNVALIGMNRTIKGNADAFAMYGVALTDVEGNARNTSEVLFDVMGAIATGKDATEQAAIATTLLGRGYKQLAPIIGMTEDQLREWTEGVSEAQAITDAEAESARDMQIAQDALGDSLMDVKLAIGEMVLELAPLITALSEVIGVIGKVLGPLGDLAGGVIDTSGSIRESIPVIGDLREGFSNLPDPVRDTVDAFKDFIGVGDENAAKSTENVEKLAEQAEGFMKNGDAAAVAAQKLLDLGASEADVDAAMEKAGVTTQELAESRKEVGMATAEAAEQEKKNQEVISASIEEVKALAAAEKERTDAMRAQVDSQFALTDAQVDFNQAMKDHGESIKEAKGDTLLMQQANNELATSAADVADAFVTIAQEQATASGTTLSSVQAADAWNASMLRQAKSAGAAGGAIIDYVAQVNQIPPDATTAIKAAVESGDFATAEAMLVELSANRTARMSVDMNTAEAEAASAALKASVETGVPIMTILADPQYANLSIAGVQQTAAANPATMAIAADPALAEAAVAETKAEADATTGTVTVDANKQKADQIIKDVEKGDYSSLVEVDANGLLALAVILAITSAKRETTIDVKANTSKAQSDINKITEKTYKAPVDAYLRDYPSAGEIQSAIGVARVPVDATLRSTPRITGIRA